MAPTRHPAADGVPEELRRRVGQIRPASAMNYTVNFTELTGFLAAFEALAPELEDAYRFEGQAVLPRVTGLRRQPAAAVAVLEQAIGRAPDDWLLRVMAAYYHAALGAYAKAADHLHAAESAPGSPHYLPGLAARMDVMAGRPADEAAALEKAKREGRLRRHLSVLQERLDRYRETHGRYPQAIGELLDDPESRAIAATLAVEFAIDPDTGQVVTAEAKRRRAVAAARLAWMGRVHPFELPAYETA